MPRELTKTTTGNDEMDEQLIWGNFEKGQLLANCQGSKLTSDVKRLHKNPAALAEPFFLQMPAQHNIQYICFAVMFLFCYKFLSKFLKKIFANPDDHRLRLVK